MVWRSAEGQAVAPCQVACDPGDELEMDVPTVTENLNLAVNLHYRDYVEAHFIRLAYSEGLMTVIGAGWVTRAELDDAPGRHAWTHRLLPQRAKGSRASPGPRNLPSDPQ
jgi:hypothetical protein